ncbi:MAG: hypothetical protein SGARI_003263 [Bacillariaceae sp.]
MGKNRRRHRKRNNNNASRRYMNFVSQRSAEAIMAESEQRKEKSEYQAMVAKLEADLLCRTVFVTNVKDLNQPGNLDRLKQFLEQTFGPVEKCEKASYGGKKRRGGPNYPPARVRMASKADAEKIFGGIPLAKAKATDVSCPSDVCGGRRGILRIQPSKRFDGMTDDQLKGDIARLEVERMSLGHWCPDDEDAFVQFSRDDDASPEIQADEFVEVMRVPSRNDMELSIDLARRCIEISSKSTKTNRDAEESFILSIIDLLLNETQVLSFRFKEMRSQMKTYRTNDGGVHLVFALKWPPKLYNESDARRVRRTSFLDVNGENFGDCRAFKVTLAKASVQMISHHKAMPKLCKSGKLP